MYVLQLIKVKLRDIQKSLNGTTTSVSNGVVAFIVVLY